MKQKTLKSCIALVLTMSVLVCGCGSTSTGNATSESEVSEASTEVADVVEETTTSEVEEFETKAQRVMAEGNAESTLSYYKELMQGTNAVFCFAYFGSKYPFDTPWEYISAMEMDQEFAFVEDIDEAHTSQDTQWGGEDVYLIIPRDEDATLQVYECGVAEDYSEEKGELLLETNDGKPILVKGDLSDVMSSFYLTIKCSDGTEVDFAPFLSGEDGYVTINAQTNSKANYTPYIWDATWYEGLEQGREILSQDLDYVWAGFSSLGWRMYGEVIGNDGIEYTYDILLDDSGVADFSYGNAETGEVIGLYEGTWERFSREEIGDKAIPAQDMMIDLRLECTRSFTGEAPASIQGIYGIEPWIQDWGFYLKTLYGPDLIPAVDDDAAPDGLGFYKKDDAG